MSKKPLAVAIASVGGAGFFPVGPGTVGSLVGLLCFVFLYYLLPGYGYSFHLAMTLLTVLLYFLGQWASNEVEEIWGHDPSKVVIDEFVGQWIALLFLPYSPVIFVAGFVLFRLFDITKPWPISRMEGLPRGTGVMMDDVFAGLISNVLLQGLVYFAPHLI